MEELSKRFGVSTDEARLIWHGCCAWTYIHWAQYRSIKTASDQHELENLIRAFYSVPPMRPVWETDSFIKAILDPDFVDWIDKILAASDTP